MQFSVKVDLKPAERLMAAADRNVRTATARALNRAADSAKTQAVRSIAGGYNITQMKVRERIKVRHAFASGNLVAEVAVQSKFGRRATNLITFGATQISGRRGVRVRIRRDRPPIVAPRWFILTNRKTGGTFVARRSGSHRTKDIKSVVTIDVGQMFNSRDINAKLRADINAKFRPEFERQLRVFGLR